MHIYLLDALHRRTRLSLVTDDDGVEFGHVLVSRLSEVGIVVGLGQLSLSLNSLLLLGVPGRSSRALLRHAVFFQGQRGLWKEGKCLTTA